jgi:Tfp pilus assembly protein FimT
MPTNKYKMKCTRSLGFARDDKKGGRDDKKGARDDKKGLTLIETLLGVALMVVLFGLSAAFYQSFQVKNDFNVATNTIAQTLRRAQMLSRTMQSDSNWGVYIKKGSITLFKGSAYMIRDEDEDEIFTVPNSIAFSPDPTEVVFDKLTGDLSSSKTLTLTTMNGDTVTLSVNSKGMVEY